MYIVKLSNTCFQPRSSLFHGGYGCEVVEKVSYLPGVKYWSTAFHTLRILCLPLFSLSHEKYQILLPLKWHVRAQHHSYLSKCHTYHIHSYPQISRNQNKHRSNTTSNAGQLYFGQTVQKPCERGSIQYDTYRLPKHATLSSCFIIILSPIWNNLNLHRSMWNKLALAVVRDWSHDSEQLKWSCSPLKSFNSTVKPHKKKHWWEWKTVLQTLGDPDLKPNASKSGCAIDLHAIEPESKLFQVQATSLWDICWHKKWTSKTAQWKTSFDYLDSKARANWMELKTMTCPLTWASERPLKQCFRISKGCMSISIGLELLMLWV